MPPCTTARVGELTGLLHAASALLLAWPLFGLPLAAGSRARQVTAGLDIGVLVAGAGVFFWHFATQQFFEDTASGKVETPAQAARLGALGYVRAQGFHFARPMTPEQLTAVIAAADLTSLAGSLAVRP